MTSEWPNSILLMWEIVHGLNRGGLTSLQRSELAERFGVGEELIARYEQARSVYDTLISEKQWREARREALRRLAERGEEFELEKYSKEHEAALAWIRDTQPKSEIERELDEAFDALRAAADATPETQGR